MKEEESKNVISIYKLRLFSGNKIFSFLKKNLNN